MATFWAVINYGRFFFGSIATDTYASTTAPEPIRAEADIAIAAIVVAMRFLAT